MEKSQATLSEDQIAILVSTAETYGAMAEKNFNLFIVVLFGSLAFATALPEGSTSTFPASLPIAIALMAFYIINFISFQSSLKNAKIILLELRQQIECWELKNPETLVVFEPKTPMIENWGLPSIGYVIGSILGFISFVCISF